jgi:hypothetical protein
MNRLTNILANLRLFKGDLDNHLVRASMVIIYFFFGYEKWFNYGAQGLIPFFTHGPLIFWMYPVFGIRGSTYLLGVSEWLFGAMLVSGTKSWGSWVLSDQLSHSFAQSRSFHSCRMAGPHLLVDFPP